MIQEKITNNKQQQRLLLGDLAAFPLALSHHAGSWERTSQRQVSLQLDTIATKLLWPPWGLPPYGRATPLMNHELKHTKSYAEAACSHGMSWLQTTGGFPALASGCPNLAAPRPFLHCRNPSCLQPAATWRLMGSES